jgi:putative DNA methylase
MDAALDRSHVGPTWLRNPKVADCVGQVLQQAATEWQLCELRAWVVMPNHVHVLLTPNQQLCRVLMTIKSASARRANRLLGRTGLPFWQEESYDHWVRSRAEESRIIRYLEFNPVRAGLATAPEEWIWSSAFLGRDGRAWPRPTSAVTSQESRLAPSAGCTE